MKALYTIYHRHSNTMKNKLHEAFENYIIQKDRKVTSDLNGLKKAIRETIEELNQKYSRCKPIKVYFTGYDQEKTIAIHTNTGVFASILKLAKYD